MQGRGAGRLRPRLSYVFIIARSGKRSRLGRRGGKVHPDLKAAETAAGVERAAAGQVNQYQLLKRGIDNKTLDALKKNKNITLLALEKLCDILDCTPNDVVTFRE